MVLKWNDVNFEDMTLRFDAHIYSSSSKALAYYEVLNNHDQSRVLDVDTVLRGGAEKLEIITIKAIFIKRCANKRRYLYI